MKKSPGFFLILSFFSFSCSLEYLKSENSEDSIPEFTFKNANYTKYESNKKNIFLSAEILEQYKSDNAVFVKNAEFQTFSSDGTQETGGECQLIAANTNDEIYTLYGDIKLNLPKQKMSIDAQALNFNKKTEQITSSKDSEVKLTKDNITISGLGFSASGVSKSFSFSNEVSGIINTNEAENEN
ncbi:LPS export ABC transporter periplasmic protein LptC [Treponema sp.]|uniref:LPS export ABC transporter periplasmic protein LptC n=1 Tax=Treponema sp. TaxID=166 RepID=UPI003890C39B